MTTKPTISRKHTKAALHLFAIHQTLRPDAQGGKS